MRAPIDIRGRRPRRGQALVEFALVAPIFFVLLIGLVEGGRYVFTAESLQHAAREGARFAIIHGATSPDGGRTGPAVVVGETNDPTGIWVKDAVREAAVGFSDGGAISINDPVYDPPNNRRGSTVTVTISYTYTPILPIFGSITVEAEASLVVKN